MIDKAVYLMDKVEELSITVLKAKIQLDADLESDIESDTHVYELYEAIDELKEVADTLRNMA